MEHDFWHNKWASGQIGFHQAEYNAFLVRHFESLKLTIGDTVFVPLCGKTRDIHWLLNQGHKVIGCELNEDAVKALFNDLNLEPEVTRIDGLQRYCADSLTVWVGDFFRLKAHHLHRVDAVYDRAAVVALPPDMRVRYTEHLLKMTFNAPQLLITYCYDQTIVSGPPFSVPDAEVEQHYSGVFTLQRLESESEPLGMKGKADCTESCWVLTPH